MSSAEYQHQLRRLRVLLDHDVQKIRPLPSAALWEARILRRAAKFRRAARRAGRKDLHRMRLAAKRLRYALEPMPGDEARRMLARMKHLQQRLGSCCDARLAAAWLASQKPQPRKAAASRLAGALRSLNERSLRRVLHDLRGAQRAPDQDLAHHHRSV